MKHWILICALAVAACSEQAETTAPVEVVESQPAAAPDSPSELTLNPNRNPYFGDLHVHTRYSFDAYLFGTRTDPDQSYAFARGGPIEHASGITVQMKRPLDFQAVTDHGTYLGMLPEMMDPDSEVGKHPVAVRIRESYTTGAGRAVFNDFLPRIGGQVENDDLLDLNVVRNAWNEIVAAAERNNAPGEFTTFIGYEYTTGGPDFENLHRNVIFAGSAHPEIPFSRLDSTNPEDMWDWLDGLRDDGIEGLAIPHNSNGSNGWMFQTTTFDGSPIDAAYAEQRMRNEPLVEVTQVKGTSDTHPLLSPNDEWADFEIMPLRVASTLTSQARGSYVREAYQTGLTLEAEIGANPYKFGLIGSSDTHNSAGSFDEDNYWSKTGVSDIQPQQRGSVPLDEPLEDGSIYAQGPSQYWGASGLAGVWAEANTREHLYTSMRRKETFATSGPRIPVRFFAGYDLPSDMTTRDDAVSQGYEHGVTMGSDLLAEAGRVPSFFAWAARDADTVPLQRLQIIKGWHDADGTHEQVYDVACAGGAAVSPETHRCPDNGATVDLSSCSTNDETGAAELTALWQDPDFDPDERAFYYVRALENPSCRWSTWDAIRAGVKPNPSMHATIQDRAWSSPVWVVP